MDAWRRIRKFFCVPPTLLELLMRAVEENDLREVKALLARDRAPTGIRVFNRGEALLVAAQRGHMAVAEALLYDGDIPVVQAFAVTNAINGAAMEGHPEIIDLLGRDYPEQFKGSFASLALWRAAQNGHSSVVSALLRNGTLPDQRLHDLPTALLAAAAKDSACAAMLLEAGADPNEVDEYGRTALHLATRKQQHKTIRLLLAAGANPNVKDRWGRTPIDLAPTEKERYLLTHPPDQ